MSDKTTKDKLRAARSFTPRKSIESLPAVEFSPDSAKEERELAQAELLQSVLRVAGLDHVTESKLVRDVVKTALGRVPAIGE
jgi:hypothetical protein